MSKPVNLSGPNLIVVGALVAAGLLFLYWSRRFIWLGLSSYWWSKTEGTVVKSRPLVVTVPGTSGPSQSGSWIPPLQYSETEFTYVYAVQGQTYRSGTYCFGGWMDRASADYSRRATVTIYYDPKHPEVSVLKRGHSSSGTPLSTYDLDKGSGVNDPSSVDFQP